MNRHCSVNQLSILHATCLRPDPSFSALMDGLLRCRGRVAVFKCTSLMIDYVSYWLVLIIKPVQILFEGVPQDHLHAACYPALNVHFSLSRHFFVESRWSSCGSTNSRLSSSGSSSFLRLCSSWLTRYFLRHWPTYRHRLGAGLTATTASMRRGSVQQWSLPGSALVIWTSV